MSDKKYTAKEAAVQVLKKAEELYKASVLSKSESKHDRCVKDVERNSPDVTNAHAVCVAEGVKPAKWNKSEQPMEKKYEGFKAVEASARKSGASDPAAVAAAAGREKYGKEAFQHAAAAGHKMGKTDAEGNNPDEAADASLGEKLEQAVEEHYNEVEAKGKTPGEGADKPEDAKLGERAEKEVHEHEARNADPAHEAPMKGHIKLAKFIGRMEHKRGKKAE